MRYRYVCDIWIRRLRVAIEVDGPFHYALEPAVDNMAGLSVLHAMLHPSFHAPSWVCGRIPLGTYLKRRHMSHLGVVRHLAMYVLMTCARSHPCRIRTRGRTLGARIEQWCVGESPSEPPTSSVVICRS